MCRTDTDIRPPVKASRCCGWDLCGEGSFVAVRSLMFGSGKEIFDIFVAGAKVYGR